MVYSISQWTSQQSHYPTEIQQEYIANSYHTVASSHTVQLVVLTQQLHYESWHWANLYFSTFNPSFNLPFSQIPK